MSDVNITSNVPTYQQIYGSQGGFDNLKQTAREDQKAALRPVAEQFEALFVSQILKEARKVKFDDGWLDGGQADFYKDWHDQQLSQSISSKGSMGLADKIVEQLAPKLPTMSKSEYDAYLLERQAQQSVEVLKPQQNQQDLAQKDTTNVAPTTSDNLALRQLKK